jgi:hypothetical protein
VFAGVVACDLAVHLMEDADGPVWTLGWDTRTVGTRVRVTIPSYSGRISLRAITKLLGLLGFGAAIGLEIVALQYSERVDDLAALESGASEQRIGRALLKAGEANRDAAQLRAAIADRDLSPKQQDDIRSSIKPFAGKTVYIRSYPNDSEAARLIIEIKTALQPTIHVEDRTGELGATWANAGLILGIHLNPGEWTERAFATALVKSLRTNGKLVVSDLSELGSSGLVEILVGVKPVALAKQVQGEIAARSALDKQIKDQGPRWRMLEESVATLPEQLRPFKGQRVLIVPCGSSNRIDAELTHVVAALTVIASRSEWELVNVRYDDNCTGGASLAVLVNSQAPERVLRAADFLSERLSNMIPLTSRVPISVGPQMVPPQGTVRYLAFEVAASTQDWVVIAVGPHP